MLFLPQHAPRIVHDIGCFLNVYQVPDRRFFFREKNNIRRYMPVCYVMSLTCRLLLLKADLYGETSETRSSLNPHVPVLLAPRALSFRQESVNLSVARPTPHPNFCRDRPRFAHPPAALKPGVLRDLRGFSSPTALSSFWDSRSGVPRGRLRSAVSAASGVGAISGA